MLSLLFNWLALVFPTASIILKAFQEEIGKLAEADAAKKAGRPPADMSYLTKIDTLRMDIDAIKNEDYGTHAKYKKRMDNTIKSLGLVPDNIENRRKQLVENEQANERMRILEPLKKQGDAYEFRVGKMYEDRGDLVAYTGFIYGKHDGGVDLVSFSSEDGSVLIMQCKHWKKRQLTIKMLDKINNDLLIYERYSLYKILSESEKINYYMNKPWPNKNILKFEIDMSLDMFDKRRVLYVSSQKSIDLVKGHLTEVSNSIWMYKETKVIVQAF